VQWFDLRYFLGYTILIIQLRVIFTNLKSYIGLKKAIKVEKEVNKNKLIKI
jgi:hypothetical protein